MVISTKLTDIALLKKFYTDYPSAIPLNNARDLTWTEGDPRYGQGPGDSSKVCAVNSNQSLIMARSSNAYYAVYELATGKCLGSIPASIYNGVHSGMNVRWYRAGLNESIVFTFPDAIYQQTWNKLETRVKLISAPSGLQFIDNGGDGDLSDNGKFYPVKLSTGYNYQTGHWENVRSAVADLFNRKLSQTIAGNPDAIDISPDGKWLLWADGLGLALTEPNRLYSISSLMTGSAVPLNIDSAIANGNKQAGHNGWAKTAAGDDAWVYVDAQDDWWKFFDTAQRKSIRIPAYEGSSRPSSAVLGYPNIHFARHAPRGFVVASTYGNSDPAISLYTNSILLIELATGKITEVCKTKTKNVSAEKFTEAAACTSWITGANAYWNCNNDGTDNVEAWSAPVIDSTPDPSVPIPRTIYEQDGLLWTTVGSQRVGIPFTAAFHSL